MNIKQSDPAGSLLDFSYGRRAAKSVSEIEALLKENPSVKALDLTCNFIGDKNITTLTTILPQYSVTELNLSANNITPTSVPAIGELLSKNNITLLNLANNEIGNGIKEIATALIGNTTLEYLNLSNTKISDSGAVALAKSLQDNESLTHLNLSSNCLGDISSFVELLPSTSLITLDISGNCIYNRGGRNLSNTIPRTFITELEYTKNYWDDNITKMLSSSVLEHKQNCGVTHCLKLLPIVRIFMHNCNRDSVATLLDRNLLGEILMHVSFYPDQLLLSNIIKVGSNKSTIGFTKAKFLKTVLSSQMTKKRARMESEIAEQRKR